MDASLVETIERGMRRTAAELLDAAQRRTVLFRRMARLFEEIDVLVTPTISAPPPATGLDPFAPFAVGNGAGEAGHIRAAWYPYTYPFNLTGHPAVAVPAGRTAAGLPASLQLVGRWHEDTLLLDVAEHLERARPWAAEWPPHAA
jgi:aspartyl-tRNA(Asn)/glutamyl-tRNA(Gln) amidotransferase subunit A